MEQLINDKILQSQLASFVSGIPRAVAPSLHKKKRHTSLFTADFSHHRSELSTDKVLGELNISFKEAKYLD